MVCPHCQQPAPIVYKGVFAVCAACDRPRAPFSGTALNFAGQPSKLGGRVGRLVGMLVLVFGLSSSAALILFFQVLWPTARIGYALGLPVALISAVLSTLFLVASRRLQSSGSAAERQARVEAIYALAVHRAGTLTASDAARALQLDVRGADALLSDLAKTEPDSVSLEFDGEGQTFYLFSHAGTPPHPFGAKYRVSSEGVVQVSEALAADGARPGRDADAPSATRDTRRAR